jgi:arylamine N-acetyltransferase
VGDGPDDSGERWLHYYLIHLGWRPARMAARVIALAQGIAVDGGQSHRTFVVRRVPGNEDSGSDGTPGFNSRHLR